MPRLPPVTTATLFENSADTIESSVIADPLNLALMLSTKGG
jgi:hypothetical protein